MPQEVLISKKEYRGAFSRFSIDRCAVRDRNIMYFTTHEIDTEHHPVMEQNQIIKSLVVFYRDEEKGNRLGWTELEGFERLSCAVSRLPNASIVAVDSSGQAMLYGSGVKGVEPKIASSPTGPMRGGSRNVRTIGKYVYLASGLRGVCRRTGVEQWESLCPPAEFKKRAAARQKQTENWGFDDIAGFSEDHFYCCGGKGDVWRYKNGDWKQCDFSSNYYLESICCGDDGRVYIGGQTGSLFVGLEDEWELLDQGGLSLPYRDLVWYDDKVWGTNSYGLWALEDGKMKEVKLEDSIKVCAGSMSVADGVMLLAGANGAAFFADGNWHLIFNDFHFQSDSDN